MPRTADPIDPHDFTAIKPAAWYSVAEVSRLFKRSEVTVRLWLRKGLLTSVRHPMSRTPMVRGETILAVAQPLLIGLVPPKIETKTQRSRRAQAAIEKIRRL